MAGRLRKRHTKTRHIATCLGTCTGKYPGTTHDHHGRAGAAMGLHKAQGFNASASGAECTITTAAASVEARIGRDRIILGAHQKGLVQECGPRKEVAL